MAPIASYGAEVKRSCSMFWPPIRPVSSLIVAMIFEVAALDHNGRSSPQSPELAVT